MHRKLTNHIIKLIYYSNFAGYKSDRAWNILHVLCMDHSNYKDYLAYNLEGCMPREQTKLVNLYKKVNNC